MYVQVWFTLPTIGYLDRDKYWLDENKMFASNIHRTWTFLKYANRVSKLFPLHRQSTWITRFYVDVHDIFENILEYLTVY